MEETKSKEMETVNLTKTDKRKLERNNETCK